MAGGDPGRRGPEGKGADRFIFKGKIEGGINQFDARNDQIDLTDYGFETFSALKKAMTQDGPNLVEVDLGANGTLGIAGTAIAD